MTIDYQVLREAAEKATQGEWVAFISSDTGTYAVHTPGDKRCEDVIKWTGFDGQKNAENNARYIAAFNPEVVQALLDERERNQQYIKRRDQENEDVALTVGKLLIENGRLVADTLRHLADNEIDSDYFAITSTNENGTEIDHEMSITDYALQAAGTVDELVAALEAAEKRNAELEAREIKPAKGEVLVVVSGFTGCGKSAIAGEIEIAMKAIGVPVQWTNGDAEKRMTGADWLTAIEMYKPTVRIVEVNVPRAAGIRIKGE
ncbi:TPA: ead/Ea22-like family protein [Escherichia coli]|nr:ead/Ea22-like family protein [Escherichia coli]HEO9135632.1 ead/Ea22-like family protein [Escherichia coli]